MRLSLVLILLIIFNTGCSRNISSLDERLANLKSLNDNRTNEQIIKAEKFNLYSIHDVNKQCSNIRIYIEGDGLSWITRRKISNDPTPINPLAFKLMNIDKSQCKIYIARPCQYVDSSNCNKTYWTNKRFSKDIVKSFSKALDKIKETYNNSSFTLIGYSGGGAIANLSQY